MMIEASVQARDLLTVWTVHNQSVRFNKFIDISESLVEGISLWEMESICPNTNEIITKMNENNLLSPIIGNHYTFDEIQRAHYEIIHSPAKGKAILTL